MITKILKTEPSRLRMIWDVSGSTGIIENGSGVWNGYSATPTWTCNNGISNTNFVESSSVQFGHTSSISSASTITVTQPHYIEDITFSHAPSGQYLISGSTIFNRSGNMYISRSAVLDSNIGSSNAISIIGSGSLTLATSCSFSNDILIGQQTSPFTGGNLVISHSVAKEQYGNIHISNSSSLLIAKSTANVVTPYPTKFIIISGSGLSATTGLSIASSQSLSAGTYPIIVANQPTIIRGTGSGHAIIDGYDGNLNHISILATASGTEIADNVQVCSPNTTYMVLISAATGSNHLNGDLVIRGPIGRGASAGYGLGIINGGSVALYGQSPAFTDRGLSVYGTSKIIISGSASLGAGSSSGNHQMVTTGSYLMFANTSPQTLTGAISGSGSLIINHPSASVTLSGNNTFAGGIALLSGSLEITGNPESIAYKKLNFIDKSAVLKIGTNNSGGYTNIGGNGVTIYGNGTGSAQLQVKSGVSFNMQSKYVVTGLPILIDRYGGTGQSIIRQFDVNERAFTVRSSASGTVISSNITTWSSGYGFRMFVESGSNNGTGDLTINGPLLGNSNSGFGLYTNGNGSVNITGKAINLSTTDVIGVGGFNGNFGGGNSTLMFTGTSALGHGGVEGAPYTRICVTTGSTLKWETSIGHILNGVISGGGNIRINTPAWLELTGNNTFTGVWDIINSQYIRVSGPSPLGTSTAAINVTEADFYLATRFGGGATTVANPISLSTGTWMGLDGGYADLTLSGVISGSGSVYTNSIGNNIMSGTNTFTGGITMYGTNTLNISGGLGSGSYAGNISIGSGNTFAYTGTTTQILSGVISGAGILNVNTPSGLTLAGTNTFSGTLNLTNGILRTDNSSGFGTSLIVVDGGANVTRIAPRTTVSSVTIANAISINSGSNLLLGTSTGDITLNGVISGSGAVTTYSTSAVSLYGVNTFTGGFTINDGTNVFLNSVNSIPSSNTIYFNNGYLQQETGGLILANNIVLSNTALFQEIDTETDENLEITGIISGGAVGNELYLSAGSGTDISEMTISGNNSYTGDTYLWRNAIICNNNNAFGTSTVYFVSNLPSAGALQFKNDFTISNDIVINQPSEGINVASEKVATMSGTFTGTDGFHKQGAGELILSNATLSITGNLYAILGTLNFSNAVPSSADYSVGVSNVTPSTSNSGLIKFKDSPDLTGKVFDIIITETGTGITYDAVTWTGTLTGTPVLEVNGVVVTSGAANANGTTVTLSANSITVTR